MSAIGEYIHLTAAGYNRFGTNYNSSDNSGSLTYNFAMAKAKKVSQALAKSRVASKMEKQKIERGLAAIMRPSTKNESEQVQKIREVILQKMNEDFNNKLGNINWGSLDVSSKTAAEQNALSKLEIIKKAPTHRTSTIEKRLKALHNTIPTITNVETRRELEDRLIKLEQQFNQIGREVCNDIEGVEWTKKILSSAHELSLIEELNSIITLSNMRIPIALQKGNLFEYAIALAPLVSMDLASENLNKILEDSVKGGQRSNVELNLDNFSKQIDWSKLQLPKYRLNDTGTAFISTLASQEKIDVEFSLNSQNALKISAKNINFKTPYDVHILSGSSLLYLLQDEDPLLINHYLNLSTEHNEAADENINLNLLKSAREAVATIVFLKALQGGTYKRASANLFIINDNSSTYGFKIFEMPELIYKAVQNFESYVKIDANGQSIDTILFKNSRMSSYTDRITRLIQDVHSYKINVALNKNIFL